MDRRATQTGPKVVTVATASRRAVVAGLPLAGLFLAGVAGCSGGADAAGSAASGASATSGSTVPSATAPMTAPPAAGEDWLALQSERDGRTEVQLVRSDGTGVFWPGARVPGGDQTNPDWSPDGTRLVFPVSEGATEDLWTVNADGTGGERILDCVEPCRVLDDPAWSPDGASIAFSRVVADEVGSTTATLELLDVATGEVRTLLTADPKDFFAGPRWFPGGQSLVVERATRDAADLYSDVVGVVLARVDLDGSDAALTELTDPALLASNPDVSPQGDRIVFGALPDAGADSSDLFTIRPDGEGLERLTTLAPSGWAYQPDYSDDGSRVLFVGRVPGGQESVLSVAVDDGRVESVDGASGPGEAAVPGQHPRSRPATG